MAKFDHELYKVQESLELDDEVVARVVEAVDGDGIDRSDLDRIVRNIAGKYLAGQRLAQASVPVAGGERG